MGDLSALNAEIRARARAEVAALNFDDEADNMPDTLAHVAAVPALFALIRRVNARELSPGFKSQHVELEVTIGIVTQSLAGRSAAMKGAAGTEALSAAVIKALHWWKPLAAFEKIKFRGGDDPLREGARLGVQLKFSTSIHETYT